MDQLLLMMMLLSLVHQLYHVPGPGPAGPWTNHIAVSWASVSYMWDQKLNIDRWFLNAKILLIPTMIQKTRVVVHVLWLWTNLLSRLFLHLRNGLVWAYILQVLQVWKLWCLRCLWETLKGRCKTWFLQMGWKIKTKEVKTSKNSIRGLGRDMLKVGLGR